VKPDITGGPTVAPQQHKAAVIPLGNVTQLNLPPDRILDAAKGQLKSVVLVGFDTDGQVYAASSLADGGSVLWLIEQLKIKLLGAA
jgi:hypothetical protein